MDYRRHALEAVTLVVAAALCASVANALASRERKLSLTAPAAVTAPRSQSSTSLTPIPTSAAAPPSTVTSPVPQEMPAVSSSARTANIASTTPASKQPSPSVPAHQRAKGAPEPSSAEPAPSPAASSAASDNPKVRFPPHKEVPWVEIDGPQAEWLYKHGALFLDARRTSVYEAGHITGARPFSVWESDIDEKTEALYGEGRDGEAPVVAYCSGGDCEDSHMLAQKLWGLFFNNVLVYKGGFPEWTQRGNPSKTGSQP